MSIETLRIIRYAAFAAIGALALVWAAIGLGWLQRADAPAVSPASGAPVVAAFELADHEGQAVGQADLLGRPAVVFFGFTYCPDVCPTTLTSLSALLGKMGADAEGLGIFFVTVDPERDTAKALKAYLSSFDPRIRGLTGTKEQIAALAKPLGVFFARSDIDGGGYTMDHTASVFLLDAQGRLISTIAYGEDEATALAKLTRLVKG